MCRLKESLLADVSSQFAAIHMHSLHLMQDFSPCMPVRHRSMLPAGMLRCRYDNTQLVNTYLAAYLLSEDRAQFAALRTRLSRDQVRREQLVMMLHSEAYCRQYQDCIAHAAPDSSLPFVVVMGAPGTCGPPVLTPAQRRLGCRASHWLPSSW